MFSYSFSFQATEMVLIHQNGIEFNQKSKSDMCNVWPIAGRSKTLEKMTYS